MYMKIFKSFLITVHNNADLIMENNRNDVRQWYGAINFFAYYYAITIAKIVYYAFVCTMQIFLIYYTIYIADLASAP